MIQDGLIFLVLKTKTDLWTDIIHQKLHGWWIAGIRTVPNLILAAIFLILFILLAKPVRKITFRVSAHVFRSKSISGLFADLIYIILLGIGIYTALNILSLDKIAISMLAGAGIIGLTLAFAFQDLTSNFISGVYFDFNKPFEIGDTIRTTDIVGRVEEIGLRSTTLRTPEGLHLLVPNKNIFQNPIVNYSKIRERKVTINFLLSIQDSMESIKQVLVDSIRGMKDLADDREIDLFFTDFDQNKLKASISFWIRNPNQFDDGSSRHAAITLILKALKDHNIERLKS